MATAGGGGGGAAGLAALLGSASPHLLIVSAAEEPAGGGGGGGGHPHPPDGDLLLFATPQPARPGAAPRRPALGRPPVNPRDWDWDGEGAARGRGLRSPGPCGLRRGWALYRAGLYMEPRGAGPRGVGPCTGPGHAAPLPAPRHAVTCHTQPGCAVPCRAVPRSATQHLPSAALAQLPLRKPPGRWAVPRLPLPRPAPAPGRCSRSVAGPVPHPRRRPRRERVRAGRGSLRSPRCCAPRWGDCAGGPSPALRRGGVSGAAVVAVALMVAVPCR